MKSRLRSYAAILLIAALIATLPSAAAAGPASVSFNGTTLTSEAYVDENGRTQAPIAILDDLGMEFTLRPGDTAGDTAVVEGYFPVRYVAESYGCEVRWNSATRTAVISGPASEVSLKTLDMAKWLYNAADEVYYQTGISYCAHPANESYETLAVFVPGAYLSGTENGDGTWTCTLNSQARVGSYTPSDAPIVMPVDTPGYSAQLPLTGYTDVTDFTSQGFVYVHAGCRGRDAGAPAGVTDLKAAIRYLRYTSKTLPGNPERIFVFGMSGGGAQSALVGAAGDSSLYEPYLRSIGAAEGVSDAVLGSMDWCPITNLDSANEAYEWMMGTTRTGLSQEERALSDALAAAFAAYINRAGIKDESGNILTLEESSEGIFQAGSYYDYIKAVLEESLNNFLSDTSFPYDASSSSGNGGGFGGGQGGFGGMRGPGGSGFQKPDGPEKPDAPQGAEPSGETDALGGETSYEERDDIARTETSSRISLTGTYETVQDYIDALNAENIWVLYDESTKKASITSVESYVKAFKPTSKSLGAFDQLDAGQGENTLFGYGNGSGAHFDAVMAEILKEQGSSYAADYEADLRHTDTQGNTAERRLAMYTPLYYLLESEGGYRTSVPARYWRIRSGAAQSDTAVTTEVNLALALRNDSRVESVDFATVWGQQHVKAERTGESDANFIQWVHDCLKSGDAGTGVPAGGNGDASGSRSRGPGGGDRNPGGGAMGVQNDEEIQAVLDENADKFKQLSFSDSGTGVTLEYSLYTPDGYDASKSYPLVMFIPDSTGAGKSARELTEQYYGADVWVTKEDQEKHPSFVLVPAFSETVVTDDWSVSNQVETAVRLIRELQKNYSIDEKRIYTTGQSMGCMTSLYLNSIYPDLFAASLFVSGQWDISVLKPLENQSFFYITAGGDAKASGGQDEVMALFDTDGVSYSFETWNAQEGVEEQNARVQALLEQGAKANMIRFETGSVFKEGQSGMEHMASFNYGYKITAVRDWLFEQARA